jgi:hypothetical protein
MVNWSGAGQGAAGGAAIGASFGPYGALIGGAAGGLIGAFTGGDDGEQNKQALEDYRRMVMMRNAPQMGDAAQASASGFRVNQQAMIDRLDALASGRGPSIASAQLNEATDRNIAAQQSFSQSGRGNAAYANMLAANNMQNLGQGAAQQSVAARLQEQQLANQLLGNTLQQARGSDEQMSQFNAQQQNYAAEANLTAKLKAMGLNDDSILNALSQFRQAAQMPTTGTQIMAGGAGALGQLVANKYGRTGGGMGVNPAMQSLASQYPHNQPYGDINGPVTMPQ